MPRAFLTALVTASLVATTAVAADLSSFRRPDRIPFPPGNPYTPEKVALGKALYFETRLSGAENMNCASCHNPSFGWEVPVATAVGAQNTRLGRQAPTILNVAWNESFFWDGRAATAEDQARGPIEAEVEMNLPLSEAVTRLASVEGYRTWFDRVFPGEGITPDTIVAAIATYERTVVASYAPFDAWVDGDETAVPEAAKRGFELFTGKGECVACHAGWNFTDYGFHDIGTTTTDIGRGALQPDLATAHFAFKTPSLRDVAQRGPYMHNGEFDTLEAVMAHYVAGGIDRPSRSPKMKPVDLSEQEIADIIAFMRSLTGERQVIALPILPN